MALEQPSSRRRRQLSVLPARSAAATVCEGATRGQHAERDDGRAARRVSQPRMSMIMIIRKSTRRSRHDRHDPCGLNAGATGMLAGTAPQGLGYRAPAHRCRIPGCRAPAANVVSIHHRCQTHGSLGVTPCLIRATWRSTTSSEVLVSVTATDFAALASRVRALEDERGILDTLHRYTRGIDYRRPEDWAAVFTEDCVYELRSKRRATHRQQGREALLQFLRSVKVGPERVFGDVEPVSPSAHIVKHLCIDPRITLDGDTARVESYFVHLDDLHGTPVLWTYGRYVDRLVRCDDGVWRIAERIVEQEALHPFGCG